jgi:pimeloyl-ACP methyl ester carboxylesterase
VEENVRGTFAELLFIKRLGFFKTFLHVVSQYDISVRVLLPYTRQLLRMLMRISDMTAYGISYHTISPKGEPVLASGVVYVPRKKKPKGVIEVSPLTRSKIDCATRDIMAAEIFPGMMGYVTIIPDLIGCGVSDHLPIAYLQHDNVAEVSVDMRKAAAQFLKQEMNYQLPNTTLLFGYSLGGSGVWALARYYQQHPELDVHVLHIFAGGGAYYPEVALRAFHASRYSDYAILPNIVFSMNYYDQLNLNFQNIFKAQLLKNYTQWCKGNIPIPELTQMLGTKIDKYLNFEFFNDQNPEYMRLMKVVTEKTIPEDWVPKAKVHLFHARHDTYVPIACFWELYKWLKRCKASVSYKLLDHDHVPAAVPFELDFISFLIRN